MILAQVTGMMALLSAVPGTAQADSRSMSLPSYLANPGNILEVPLTLDNAAGLAAIRVQINFDPEVLELQAVTAGPLGEAFELNQGDGTEHVNVMGTIPATGPDAKPKGFLRVVVEKP